MADEAEVGKYFTGTIARDLLELVSGRLIGRGQYRYVHACELNPDWVIKFELGSKCFQNIIEWETWNTVVGTKYEKHFTPCMYISPCGTILLQKFARDVEVSELPLELPRFFTDIKKSNFGVLNGQVVCRDYGANLLMINGLSSRTKKVEWNLND